MLKVKAAGESSKMGSAGGHPKASPNHLTPEIDGVPAHLETGGTGNGAGAECLQARSNSHADEAGESRKGVMSRLDVVWNQAVPIVK